MAPLKIWPCHAIIPRIPKLHHTVQPLTGKVGVDTES